MTSQLVINYVHKTMTTTLDDIAFETYLCSKLCYSMHYYALRNFNEELLKSKAKKIYFNILVL